MSLRYVVPVLLAGLGLAAGCTGSAQEQVPLTPAGKGETTMNLMPEPGPDTRDLTLEAHTGEGWDSRLVPEQAAIFRLTLTNTGRQGCEVVSMDGNSDTPRVQLLDTDVALTDGATPRALESTMFGDLEPPVNQPLVTRQLAGKEQETTFVNLWNFARRPPLGAYNFEAIHTAGVDGGAIAAKRIPFQIVPAHIGSAAMAYDTPGHSGSVLAWTATAPQIGTILLVRVSGNLGHSTVQSGGIPQAKVPVGVSLATSIVPLGLTTNGGGWVAMADGKRITIFRHDLAAPVRQGVPVESPVANPLLLQRFPDRGHAVVLATGEGPRGPALMGVTVAEDGAPAKPWTVPLAARPVHAACVSGPKGPISLLLISETATETHIRRMEIDESGEVLAEETVVRTTGNRVLAVAPDMRPGQPPAFVLLEADPGQHNRIRTVVLPLDGGPRVPEGMTVLAGWPGLDAEGEGTPAPAAEICLEMALDGIPWVALTDAAGALYGGRIGGRLALLRDAEAGRKAMCPHIAALYEGTTIACFTETGALFHAGAPGDQ